MLGMARKLSPALITVHQRFIQQLEKHGELDRALEFLPSDERSRSARPTGVGLTSPENAVLAAYAKITLTRHIEDSTLPDEPWFRRVLAEYFPPLIAERFADDLHNHPLHREIITTVIVNDMINRSGTTYVHRAIEETGAAGDGDHAGVPGGARDLRPAGTLGRHRGARQRVPTAAQHAAYREIRRLIDRATRWFVDVRFPISDVDARDRAVRARRCASSGRALWS